MGCVEQLGSLTVAERADPRHRRRGAVLLPAGGAAGQAQRHLRRARGGGGMTDAEHARPDRPEQTAVLPPSPRSPSRARSSAGRRRLPAGPARALRPRASSGGCWPGWSCWCPANRALAVRAGRRRRRRRHRGGDLRHRGPLPQHPARVRRPDLVRPRGVRRHRRLHLGVRRGRPAAELLVRAPDRRRGRRAAGRAARRGVAAADRPVLRARHPGLRRLHRADPVRDHRDHRRRGRQGRAPAGRVRVRGPLLPALPGASSPWCCSSTGG